MAINTPATKDFATEAGHWYAADGAPAYTLVGANGKERNTTLRDARKLGLFPSVSAILQMEAKPNLTHWLVKQALLSAMTLPRIAYESDDAFMERALWDSKEQARAAAERGTHLHGVMEQSLHLGRCIDPRETSTIQPVLDWIHATYPSHVWSVERSFASASGFGGKLDLYGSDQDIDRAVVIDYKFKDFRDVDKPLAYPEHATQLAAYAYGVGGTIADCMNLFISSTVPGLFVPHSWTATERDTGWQCFNCLLQLWKLRKGYLL